jgi:Uma2 family endonuclease
MSAAPTLPLVPVEEYLNSSYHPDMEYVDGVLVESAVPTIPHSVLQMILIQFFARFQEASRFLALPGTHTNHRTRPLPCS